MFDNINKNVETIDNNSNNENNNSEDEDIDDSEEEESESEEEEEDGLSRDQLEANSDDYKNNTRIDLLFDDNYGNAFDDESDEQTDNRTDIYADKRWRQKYRNNGRPDGEPILSSGQVIGRSADGYQRYNGLGRTQDKVNDIHGNKVNIEVDPQQPAYDEAISSIVDEMGGIHIHDGPGGTFALPDRNHINRFQSTLNFNDKDLGFIEKIAADRRPIVRVTRVRKRVRTGDDDLTVEDVVNDQRNSYNIEKNIKNQYIPVIVMDKEDIDSSKEEKIRRYRSDNNFKNLKDEMSGVSPHFQNQKRQQQQHFREQNRPKMSLSAAIPIAVPTKELNKTLEFRALMATRNDGKVVAIPIFRDMVNGMN